MSDWFLSVANQRLNNSCWQNSNWNEMLDVLTVALVGQRNWNEINFFKSDKCSFVHLNFSLSFYLSAYPLRSFTIHLSTIFLCIFCFYTYFSNDTLQSIKRFPFNNCFLLCLLHNVNVSHFCIVTFRAARLIDLYRILIVLFLSESRLAFPHCLFVC